MKDDTLYLIHISESIDKIGTEGTEFFSRLLCENYSVPGF